MSASVCKHVCLQVWIFMFSLISLCPMDVRGWATNFVNLSIYGVPFDQESVHSFYWKIDILMKNRFFLTENFWFFWCVNLCDDERRFLWIYQCVVHSIRSLCDIHFDCLHNSKMVFGENLLQNKNRCFIQCEYLYIAITLIMINHFWQCFARLYPQTENVSMVFGSS